MPQWEHVRPILVVAYDLMEQSADGETSGNAIASALDIEDERLGHVLTALHEARYIDCDGRSVQCLPFIVGGTEKGRQEIQGWPGPRTSTANVELLMELLREKADAPDTPSEQRTKLRAIGDAITKGGIDAMSQVIADVILRAGGHIT